MAPAGRKLFEIGGQDQAWQKLQVLNFCYTAARSNRIGAANPTGKQGEAQSFIALLT
jgi:hypothetical protein